jgi:TolA-binding protein
VSSPACDRAALVEALFDGRLGPSELASTERHLKSCNACAELARDLSSLQALLRASSSEILPLEHQRARIDLLRRSAAVASPKRRPRALLLVAALLMMPVAVWAAKSALSSLREADAAQPVSAPLTAAARRKPARREPPATRTPNAAPTAPADSTPAPPGPASPAPLRAAQPLASTPPPTRQRTHRAAVETPTAVRSTPQAAEASRAFADGMAALARGDFSAAASKLEGFALAHPHDPRVEDAVYVAAIALERAGRSDDARAAARRYLAEYPAGAHHVQAQRIAGD